MKYLKALILAATLLLASQAALATVTHSVTWDHQGGGNPNRYALNCNYYWNSADALLWDKIWYVCATFIGSLPGYPANGSWPNYWVPIGLEERHILAAHQNCHPAGCMSWHAKYMADDDGDGNQEFPPDLKSSAHTDHYAEGHECDPVQ